MVSTEAKPDRARPHRFDGLDFLRGLAAIGVMFAHIGGEDSLFGSHGYLAVDFFFILSGLVVAHAYDRQLRERGRLPFIWVRLIRLYPLIAIGTLLGAILFADRDGIWLNLLAGMLVLPSPASFSPLAYALNAPMWSLFGELLVNFGYALFFPLLTVRRLIGIAAISGAVLLAVSLLIGGLDTGAAWHPSFAVGSLRALFGFTIGVLILRCDVRVPPIPVALASLAMILTLVAPRDWSAWFDPLMIMIAFPLIVAGVRRSHMANRRMAALLGDMSYPLYILHMPVVLLVRRWAVPGTMDYPTIAAITAGLAIVVAVMAMMIDKRLRASLTRAAARRGLLWPTRPTDRDAAIASVVSR